MYILIAPLVIKRPVAKDFSIGLNTYRNLHYKSLNNLKIEYKEIMKKQILALPAFTKVELTYTLYPKTKRLCDLDNMLSVQAKFLGDALVDFKKLPDDNYKYLPKITFLMGVIDKINPRVTIEIKEIA